MTVGIIVISHHWIFCTIVLNFRKMFVEQESYNVVISYNLIIFFKSYGVITTVIFAVCKKLITTVQKALGSPFASSHLLLMHLQINFLLNDEVLFLWSLYFCQSTGFFVAWYVCFKFRRQRIASSSSVVIKGTCSRLISFLTGACSSRGSVNIFPQAHATSSTSSKT